MSFLFHRKELAWRGKSQVSLMKQTGSVNVRDWIFLFSFTPEPPFSILYNHLFLRRLRFNVIGLHTQVAAFFSAGLTQHKAEQLDQSIVTLKTKVKLYFVNCSLKQSNGSLRSQVCIKMYKRAVIVMPSIHG